MNNTNINNITMNNNNNKINNNNNNDKNNSQNKNNNHIKNNNSKNENKIDANLLHKEKNLNMIKLTIENYEDNQDIYILDNTEYEDEEGNKHSHEELKELNDSNTYIIIGNKTFKYYKKFNFPKGKFEVKIIFNILITNCKCMFYNCKNIVSIDLSSFNAKNVKNMSYMFFGCSDLVNINLSSFLMVVLI